MISPNPQPICEESRAYFHDYLDELARNDIPRQNLDHMTACPFCLAEIDRLKNVLGECSEDEHERDSLIRRTLELHFASIDKPVDCQTVKLFLPTLADPATPVRVPTPITVHIDHCIQCSKDLETIRHLQLTGKQLHQLGQIFAEKPSDDHDMCEQATSFMETITNMVFDGVEPNVLNHCCICPSCRQLMLCRRHIMIHKLREAGSVCQHPLCSGGDAVELAPGDIFTYCFPYGFDSANDEYANFRPAFTSHASTCIASLEKMQQLHTTINDMLVRENSGVVTLVHLSDEAKAEDRCDEKELYAGLPLEVEVLGKSDNCGNVDTNLPQQSKSVASSSAHSRNIIVRSFVRFAAPTIAAAVLLIAILIFSNPTVKATGVGELYKAVKGVRNIHRISKIEESPILQEELWVSEDMGVKIIVREEVIVLWNMKNRIKKTRELTTNNISTEELDDNALQAVARTFDIPQMILPFSSIAQLNDTGAKWQPVEKDPEGVSKNVEVYELLWQEETVGDPLVSYSWRFYLNRETKLPERIEHRSRTGNGEFEPKKILEVSYPTDEEVSVIIRSLGF